jgi:hypothetical protein
MDCRLGFGEEQFEGDFAREGGATGLEGFFVVD